MLGRAARRNGSAPEDIEGLFAEALALFREAGDDWAAGHVLAALGGEARRRGDLTGARRLYEQALSSHRKLAVPRSVAITLLQLGHIAQAEGAHQRAWNCYREALIMFRDTGDKSGLGSALFGLAAAVAPYDRRRAARLMGAAQGLTEAASIDPRYALGAGYEGALRALLDTPPGANTAAAWAEGRTMPFEAAIADALATPEPTPPRTTGAGD